LVLAVVAGCLAPIQPGLRNDGYDQAYLTTRRQEDGCRKDTAVRCCAEIQQIDGKPVPYCYPFRFEVRRQ
jgi:hypothetical protein